MANRNFTQPIPSIANGLQLAYKGALDSGASVSVSGQSHDIFVVAVGTWNYSGLIIVMPNNGNTPKAKCLMSYGNTEESDAATLTRFSFEANGSWGIKITNTTTVDQVPVMVFLIKKHY